MSASDSLGLCGCSLCEDRRQYGAEAGAAAVAHRLRVPADHIHAPAADSIWPSDRELIDYDARRKLTVRITVDSTQFRTLLEAMRRPVFPPNRRVREGALPAGPRPVRLETNGLGWRVQVYRRSWLRLGRRAWVNVAPAPCTSFALEFYARERYAAVVRHEQARYVAKRDGWRVVEAKA